MNLSIFTNYIKTELNKFLKSMSYSVQDSIPIEFMYDDGTIFSNGLYTKMYRIENINYFLLKDEERNNVYLDYSKLLNSLDQNCKLQWYFINNKLNQLQVEEIVLIPDKNDSYSEHRQVYNGILKNKIKECRRKTADKRLYVLLTVDDYKYETALDHLNRCFSDIQSQLRKIGSHAYELSDFDVVQVIHEYYNPDRREEKSLYKTVDYFLRGLDAKDLIAPPSTSRSKNYLQVGRTFSRTLIVNKFATSLTDNFLGELLSHPFSYSVSVHVEPTDSTKAIELIKRKLTSMNMNKMQYTRKGGLTLQPYIPYELKESMEEAENILEALSKKNKKLFLMSIYINVVAYSMKELNERTADVKASCRKALCFANNLNHQQEQGFISAAPLGHNTVNMKRAFLTDAAAIFIPFSTREIFQPGGFYYGINQESKNMIILNRKLMVNPAGIILGMPRCGKSFATKREIVNVLISTNDDVIIIDPENEYLPLTMEFGGEVIEISPTSTNFLNAMDIDPDYGAGEKDPINAKIDFLISFCECISGMLSAGEMTVIDRCARKIYTKFMANFNYDEMPLLEEFMTTLREQPEPEAKKIALDLELYVSGCYNTFSKKTNVNVNKRITTYNILNLGNNLKKLAMLVILNNVWNRVLYNYSIGKRTWVYVDEFSIFFSKDGKSENTTAFFNNFFKRSQKRGCIPTAITQNLEEILDHIVAKTMISNSDLLLLFKQAPSDREKLSKMLAISDTHLTYVKNPAEGQGLMCINGVMIPFEDKFPKDNILYEKMTTKVTDLFDKDKEKGVI